MIYQIRENGRIMEEVYSKKEEARKRMKELRHKSLMIREDNIYELVEKEIEGRYESTEDIMKWYKIDVISKGGKIRVKKIEASNNEIETRIRNSTRETNTKEIRFTIEMKEVLNKRKPYKYIINRAKKLLCDINDIES